MALITCEQPLLYLQLLAFWTRGYLASDILKVIE